jgi:hypothetical protein
MEVIHFVLWLLLNWQDHVGYWMSNAWWYVLAIATLFPWV